MKTDQEILEELKQAGGGERKRSFGLTAFIILLAIIIGVFTYLNRQDEDNTANNDENSVAVTEETENSDTTENESVDENMNENEETETTDATNEESSVIEETNVSEDTTQDQQEDSSVESLDVTSTGEAVGELPNDDSTHTDTAYTEVAQSGEGVTHLARRAMHGYLAEQGIDDLSAEHKVFIEDYLAKMAGPYWIDIGHTMTFETSQLDAAISAARALTADQLANLEQYSALVPGL